MKNKKKINEAEERRKRELVTEEARRKYQEDKLKKEIEQQRIKERIRLDKLEREANKKEEEERLRIEQQKKEKQTETYMENGILKITRVTSNEDLQNLEHHSGDPIERSITPPLRPNQKGIATLSSMHPPDDDDDDPTPKSKDDWTMPILYAKYRKYGKQVVSKLLQDSGFDDDDVAQLLRFIMLIEAQNKMNEVLTLGSSDGSIKDDQKFKAFQGKGMTLSSQPLKSHTTIETEESLHTEENPSQIKYELVVDPSKPTTTIQIRLQNGSKITGTFNLTHTIKDIRMYIQNHVQGSSFELMLTYPKKTLSDPSQTIASCGLSNAVIIVTPK